MRVRNTPHTVASLLEVTRPDSGCSLWQGASHANGYGVASYKGKQTTVHRVMYQLYYGETIPEGMEIDHTCNNRLCINPQHLELVTHQENMQRALSRRTECKAGHPWTDENTYTTTVKRKQGGIRYQRFCRVCRAKHQADLRERKRT